MYLNIKNEIMADMVILLVEETAQVGQRENPLR